MNKIEINEFEKEKYSYETFVRVGDLNYGNHLAHDKLIAILHDARVCFFKEKNLTEINLENCFSIYITSLTINYLAQAFLGDKIKVSIFINNINKASFEMKYKVFNQGLLIALCATNLACYNNLKKRCDKIPSSLLSVLT